jgi:hypothetical protein
MAPLSDSQLVVLSTACQREDRSVYPLTAKLPGGAATKVLNSLLSKGLIKEVQAKREDHVWREHKKQGRLTLRATPAAFEALGITTDDTAAPSNQEATTAQSKPTKGRKRKEAAASDKTKGKRTDSKQAKLIEMLKRSDGATIDEIAKKFDWQAHTVRGAIAGALKKKLGLDVTSEKIEGRGRVYRIAA